MRARTLFVVAAASVDQNGETGPPDQKALDGDDQDPARRILKARHEPGAVLIEMRLRAVAEDLERRQDRAFGFDDPAQGRCAKRPVRLSRHEMPTIAIPTAAVDGCSWQVATPGKWCRFTSTVRADRARALAHPRSRSDRPATTPPPKLAFCRCRPCGRRRERRALRQTAASTRTRTGS